MNYFVWYFADNCEPDPCKATKEWLEKTPTKTNVKKQIVGVGKKLLVII